MRALVTSDWHVDWVTFGIARFDEIERAAMMTADRAVAEKCDHYFFLGDLCDPDSGPVVFRCVDLAIRIAMKLAQHEIKSTWLVGNHDVIEDGSGTSTLLPLSNISPFVSLLDRPQILEYTDSPSILALPFTPTSHTYDPEKYVDELLAVEGPAIVLSHLTVHGIIPGEETREMPRGRDVLLPLEKLAKRPETTILQGHYHRRQSHGKLHIPGSLARLTFSEVDHTPSFLLVQ